MPKIQLQCLPARDALEADRGKFAWLPDTGGMYAHYYSPSALNECKNHIVAALNKLVKDLSGGKRDDVGAALRAVAVQGHALYSEIFNRNRGGFHDAEAVRKWLAGLDDVTLTMMMDDRVHVPWGLVFDQDPDGIPDDADPDHDIFKNFWCVKYNVRALHMRHIPYGHRVAETQNASWIFGTHHTELKEALSSMRASLPEESAAWEKLSSLQMVGGANCDLKSLWDAWKRRGSNCDILYLYCHGNSDTISLGPEDSESAMALSRHLQKPADCTLPSLVFLNGCETAIGELGRGFLDATAGPGLCGMIGTEAKVPRVVAKRFALAFFLEMLTSGKAASEVMSLLRVRHWPLSVVYSFNAIDAVSYRNAPEQLTVPPSLMQNLSYPYEHADR